jgi:putative hydrolase of the HAD superfamily
MKFEAVLFDAAETLFTTRGSVGEIYGRVAQEYGSTASFPEIQAAFLRQFRHSGPLSTEDEKTWWKDVVFRVFQDVGMVERFDEFFEKVYDQFRDARGWTLFPETREVLESLKDRGIKLGVVSNFDSRVYNVMRALDILSFFDAVTISSETGYAKPQPEIFKLAAIALHTEPARVLLVGDSLRDDVIAGRQAGLQTVLIDRSEKHQFGEVAKIRNLRDVFAFL